jgi:isoleucyl-tRNA synthetase
LLFDHPCYRNVICHGHILDATGEKMSKSKGNVVDLWATINKHGADTLRWYLYTAVPLGNSIRFDEDAISEISRRFLMTLWNVYSFFVTYANIDKYVPEPKQSSLTQSELDHWILSELNQLIINVDMALDKYDPRSGASQIANFVDGLSNWYVRRSRRRFWKSENDTDKLSAYNTLYHCLVTVAKLLAPFTPFIAEELYRNLVCATDKNAPESVHLVDYPVADESKIDRDLSLDTHLAMRVSSLGRAARAQAGIKVRQPLEKVCIRVPSKREREGLERLSAQVMEELNVKALEFVEKAEDLNRPGLAACTEGEVTIAVPKEIPPELIAEGMAREIVHRLQTMRRSAGFEIADYINTYYQGDEYVRQVMDDYADYLKQETLSRQFAEGPAPEGAYSETHKLSGHTIVLGVKRQD